jgi:hypothetical protein
LLVCKWEQAKGTYCKGGRGSACSSFGVRLPQIDSPGAFLHTNNKDYVIMKMVGMLAELMVKMNPKLYRKYVVIEKGRLALYL